MVVIASIVITEKFEKDVKKIRDEGIKARIGTEVNNLRANHESGKPLRYGLKGERTVRINPYRLIYAIEGANLILLRFEHRKDVYG